MNIDDFELHLKQKYGLTRKLSYNEIQDIIEWSVQNNVVDREDVSINEILNNEDFNKEDFNKEDFNKEDLSNDVHSEDFHDKDVHSEDFHDKDVRNEDLLNDVRNEDLTNDLFKNINEDIYNKEFTNNNNKDNINNVTTSITTEQLIEYIKKCRTAFLNKSFYDSDEGNFISTKYHTPISVMKENRGTPDSEENMDNGDENMYNGEGIDNIKTGREGTNRKDTNIINNYNREPPNDNNNNKNIFDTKRNILNLVNTKVNSTLIKNSKIRSPFNSPMIRKNKVENPFVSDSPFKLYYNKTNEPNSRGTRDINGVDNKDIYKSGNYNTSNTNGNLKSNIKDKDNNIFTTEDEFESFCEDLRIKTQSIKKSTPYRNLLPNDKNNPFDRNLLPNDKNFLSNDNNPYDRNQPHNDNNLNKYNPFDNNTEKLINTSTHMKNTDPNIKKEILNGSLIHLCVSV